MTHDWWPGEVTLMMLERLMPPVPLPGEVIKPLPGGGYIGYMESEEEVSKQAVHRINMEISKKQFSKMKKLADDLDTNYTGLFRMALGLLSYIVRENKNGGKLKMHHKKGGVTQIVFPGVIE